MVKKLNALKARGRFKRRLLFGLVFKPLRLFCEHCDKYIPSDMEWKCAHCNHENRATRYYSFLNKCQNCKRLPQAVVCPHCEELNFLDKHKIGSHPASQNSALVPPILPPTKEQIREQSRAEKQEDHADRKDDLNREIEIARLNADLAKCKMSAEFGRERIAMEKVRKSFSEHEAHVMGIKMVVKEKRSEYAETFKDDPEGLKDANDSLDMWAEEETMR
jgi:hypothetical protein